MTDFSSARRIRLGLVGGGSGSFIGPVHRFAARLDDRFDILAGVFSSDPTRSVASAREIGVPRAYPDVATMLDAESVRRDGIEAIAIMTPNDRHAEPAMLALKAGLDVICDKPLTNDLASAIALAREAKARDRILVVTYNYSGYPMAREARAAVAAGELGCVRLVMARYLQSSLSLSETEALPARVKWRVDSKRGGESYVLSDIGVHAHHLIEFVTGQAMFEVSAAVGALRPGQPADDTALVNFRLEEGALGSLSVSKIAVGERNLIEISVYGDLGGLSWSSAEPEKLVVKRHNRPDEVRMRGLPDLHPETLRSSRLPAGHPEAFIEAFANIYSGFADRIEARQHGASEDRTFAGVPDAGDGVAGLTFIQACKTSSDTGRWTSVARQHA